MPQLQFRTDCLYIWSALLRLILQAEATHIPVESSLHLPACLLGFAAAERIAALSVQA